MHPFNTICKFIFILTLVSTMLGGNAIYSQDVHFSQFDASPLSLNPANTGNFNGFWRFSANYRSQWRVLDYPFVSYSAGYERNFVDKNAPISAGVYLLHDQSGEAEISYNKIMIPISTSVGNDGNKLSFGIQPGFVSKRLNKDRLTFPNQYDPNTGFHDPSFANGENLGSAISFFDINAGIAWQKVFGSMVLKTGIAAFHLTQPNESFIGQGVPTPIRKVFHLSLAVPISDNWMLIPKILMHEQTKASEFISGLYAVNLLPPNQPNIQSVFVGVMSRFGVNRNLDAVMPIVGINYERWDFGISYDINLSSLKTATNNRGAIELSLIFWNGKVRLNRTTIICERF